MPVNVSVQPIPPWLDASRLLGEGVWTSEGTRWSASLERKVAADVAARLRGLGFAGTPIRVDIQPKLKPGLIRAGRTRDARARRTTTPGFSNPHAKTDAEGRWSLTPEALAMDLAERWAGKRVIDATCGVGGNAIAFARAGCEVVAIDLHASRLELAQANAHAYQVAPRIQFLHGDALQLLPGLEADVVFVDPPWGTKWDRTHSRLEDLPLLEPLIRAIPKHSAWIAKGPPSFDPGGLPQGTPEAWFGVAEGDQHRVKFLTVTFRPEP